MEEENVKVIKVENTILSIYFITFSLFHFFTLFSTSRNIEEKGEGGSDLYLFFIYRPEPKKNVKMWKCEKKARGGKYSGQIKFWAETSVLEALEHSRLRHVTYVLDDYIHVTYVLDDYMHVTYVLDDYIHVT